MLQIAKRVLRTPLSVPLAALRVALSFSTTPYVCSFKLLLYFLDIIDVDRRICAQGGSCEVPVGEGNGGLMQEVKALVRPEF